MAGSNVYVRTKPGGLMGGSGKTVSDDRRSEFVYDETSYQMVKISTSAANR